MCHWCHRFHNHSQNPHNHGLPAGIVTPAPFTGSTNATTAAGSTFGFKYSGTPPSNLEAVHQSATATNNASGTGIGVNGTTATNQAATSTNNAVAAANASSAHNNLQPYITCYMFKRTA